MSSFLIGPCLRVILPADSSILVTWPLTIADCATATLGSTAPERTRMLALVAASILVLSGAVLPRVAVAQSAMVNGQVTKIDESAGKITLKHGPIKKLDMNEGMTMVFRVQDPAMLKQVKVGDKVRFDADRVNGQITVTKIEKAR